MKIVVKYLAEQHPPLLQLSVFEAPHRRMHVSAIQHYREHLYFACAKAGIAMPIDHPIDLSVIFIDPTSPDLDNLIMALFRAMDGHTLKKPAVLTSDGLISKVTMSTLFHTRKK
jgi:Holliday junction resolvase RusA-like endonuclease